VLKINERVIAPNLAFDLFATDELPGLRDQQQQELGWLGCELGRMSRVKQLASPGVQFEWTEAKS